MTRYITFLGPVGATFSHDGYDRLAMIYGTPLSYDKEVELIPAQSNEEVLRKIIDHKGFGALAMQTLARGRLATNVESFIDLLSRYGSDDECPIQILGAIHQKLHFCLIAREGVALGDVTQIIAHPEALNACKDHIAASKLPPIPVSSNGEAARLISEDDAYATGAALGPISASEKYRLNILNNAFEDKESITTFFLIGPRQCLPKIGKENRALIVFSVPHKPNALAKVLGIFGECSLNLTQIHSMHVGNHTYNFVIELEMSRDQLATFETVMEKFREYVPRFISFGPFEICS